MHPLDWAIVAGLLIVLLVAALTTYRYTKSVGAFLVANRCGGRYIITLAHGMAGIGVITLVTYMEMYYEAGFSGYWWGTLTEPAVLIVAVTGWIAYRFRQTRAMTLAQFFEMRYSRSFRVFAGLVAFLSGLVNFGIFPAVGARFFIALCGLPDTVDMFGIGIGTYPLVMIVLLSTSLLFTFLGGHIAVMVTDFLQGTFANIVFAILIVYLLLVFDWESVTAAVLQAPEDKSLIHPFKMGGQEDFNIFFYLITVAIMVYTWMGWQGTQGYYCCAKNAHEAKMSNILLGWRWRVLLLIVVVVPICIFTMLRSPEFAAETAAINAKLDLAESDAIRNQIRTPLALAALLPVGLLGLTCAAMLGAFISTHDTYLHSWGTMLVQDVILPFKKEPFTPRQHLWALRASIFGVAAFIFMFSMVFRYPEHLIMFLAITGAIFVGGAGSAIIGGLYWKRGTTPAAWTAMITGMVLSVAGIVVKKTWPDFGPSGMVLSFYAAATSVLLYVLVSLAGPRRVFDLDKMLHRDEAAPEKLTILERLGFGREFTGRDRVITYVTAAWPVAWTGILIAATVYNLNVDVPDSWWLRFWHIWTWVVLGVSIVVTVWFAIGGFFDMRYLFRHLRGLDDPDDDGRV